MTTSRPVDFEEIEISDEVMRTRIAATQSYSLVLLSAGPGYATDDARRIIWEHGRRNMRLNDAGILRIVCPVRDETPLCGVGIFAATPEQTATIMDGDPGVQAGVFTYELHSISGFPGSTL